MNLTAEQKYQLLLEIAQKTRDTLDLDEIMNHILDTIRPVVDYDAAGVFVLNKDFSTDHLPSKNVIAGVCWRGYHPMPDRGKDEMLTHGKGISGYVIFSGSSLIVPDVRKDDRYIEGRKETRSEIAVPILRDGQPIGALNLESDQLRAFDESHLGALQFFADAAAIALDKAILHRQLLDKELLDRQIQMARDVQLNLLPKGDPKIPGCDIASICLPAESIGGDYYDYLELPEGQLGIAVADVSGHGIASALAMTGFRGLLRTHTRGKVDPARTARSINRLLPHFTGENHFITMAYAALDPKTCEVTIVSCGHPPTWLVHPDGSAEHFEQNGPGMGVFSRADYANESKSLSPGDILLLNTDGVLEMENPYGKAFGEKRLIEVIRKNRTHTAKELILSVILAAQAFTGRQTYTDDFTVVVVKKE
jgi:sigma-B regulation protein RsbU (phosphoserine phosphatase)